MDFFSRMLKKQKNEDKSRKPILIVKTVNLKWENVTSPKHRSITLS